MSAQRLPLVPPARPPAPPLRTASKVKIPLHAETAPRPARPAPPGRGRPHRSAHRLYAVHGGYEHSSGRGRPPPSR